MTVSPLVIAITGTILFLLIVYMFVSKNRTPYLSYNDMKKQDGAMKYVAETAVTVAPLLPQGLVRQKPDARDRLERKINSAGNPWHVTPPEYIVIRYTMMIIGAVAGFIGYWIIGKFVGLPWILWPLILGAVGYLIPDYVYDNATKERTLRFKIELPEALDLLAISTSAGSTFKTAMDEVVPLLRPGVVQDELAKVNADIKSGNSVVGALNNLAARAPNPDTRSFVKAIKQNEEYGSNSDISRTLRARAETNREEYNSYVENKIAKMSSNMMGVLTIGMVAPMLIISLAPMLSLLAQVGLF